MAPDEKSTPEELLQRASGIFRMILSEASLDDHRELTADLREWQLRQIEKWIKDHETSNGKLEEAPV
jgi:hypothetical protein